MRPEITERLKPEGKIKQKKARRARQELEKSHKGGSHGIIQSG